MVKWFYLCFLQVKADEALHNDMEETFLSEEIQAQSIQGPASQRILALFVSNSKKLQVCEFGNFLFKTTHKFKTCVQN